MLNWPLLRVSKADMGIMLQISASETLYGGQLHYSLDKIKFISFCRNLTQIVTLQNQVLLLPLDHSLINIFARLCCNLIFLWIISGGICSIMYCFLETSLSLFARGYHWQGTSKECSASSGDSGYHAFMPPGIFKVSVWKHTIIRLWEHMVRVILYRKWYVLC